MEQPDAPARGVCCARFHMVPGRSQPQGMNYLAKDPIIKNSQIFFDFLYIGAETDFNSKKKYTKMSKLYLMLIILEIKMPKSK